MREATYAWDWASGLPEMLSESGNLYLVGQETLGQWDGDEWAYYLPDGLGSVRQVIDETGAVTDAREWTPYGVEVGTVQAGLGYTGEWQDPALGLQYLRARWYDGYLNQFVSPDPIVPDYRNPQSINRYAYTLGNPVNFVDPSGHCAEGDGLCISYRDGTEAMYNITIVDNPYGPYCSSDGYNRFDSWTITDIMWLRDTLDLLERFMGESQFDSHIGDGNTRFYLFPWKNSGNRENNETFWFKRIELATKMRRDGRTDFIWATMHECYHAYGQDESQRAIFPEAELYRFENRYGKAVGWTGDTLEGWQGVLATWPTDPPDDVAEYKEKGLKPGDPGFNFYLDYIAYGPNEDWAESATRFTMLWMAGKLDGSEFSDQTAADVLSILGPFELGEARYKFLRKHFGKRCDGGNYGWCAQQDAAGEY